MKQYHPLHNWDHVIAAEHVAEVRINDQRIVASYEAWLEAFDVLRGHLDDYTRRRDAVLEGES